MDRRLARIKTKIAAIPPAGRASLGPPLAEQRVSGFEDSHGMRLPEEFRQFILHVGHTGYGPAYGLLPIEKWLGMPAGGGRGPASPFPFAPDVEVPQPSAGVFAGTITLVHRGV